MQFQTFITCVLLATAILLSHLCVAQNIKVVEKTKIYRQEIKKDSTNKMVELKSRMPSLLYDLRYFTTSNFTGEQLYTQNKTTFLRLPVANALERVNQQLLQKGLTIKIFDAYRPYSVTKKMWELIKDERYVANPAKGSGHNRGLSVDLTLIHLHTGKELDMGTAFDNFTDTAHHGFTNLSIEVLENRKLLKAVMEAQGFRALETEWWHYSWPNDKGYTIMDLSFKQLQKYSR
jgi:D-alanyl-D-alanine dipeptidase